jgi:hypothetical protein
MSSGRSEVDDEELEIDEPVEIQRTEDVKPFSGSGEKQLNKILLFFQILIKFSTFSCFQRIFQYMYLLLRCKNINIFILKYK